MDKHKSCMLFTVLGHLAKIQNFLLGINAFGSHIQTFSKKSGVKFQKE